MYIYTFLTIQKDYFFYYVFYNLNYPTVCICVWSTFSDCNFNNKNKSRAYEF